MRVTPPLRVPTQVLAASERADTVPPPPPRASAKLPAMYARTTGETGPAIVGLDRCAAWRSSTSLFRRSAVAGMFNSGTIQGHNRVLHSYFNLWVSKRSRRVDEHRVT